MFMKHHLLGKKIISFALCLILLISNNASIFADSNMTEKSDSDRTKLEYVSDDIKVRVEAGNTVIPEDITLKVKKIEKDTELKDLAGKLMDYAQENKSGMLGFFAYDIALVNGQGEEIEPEGDVNVSISYNKATSPDTVGNDAEADVSLLHFDESGKSVKVEDITDQSQICVNDNNEVKDVEFVTDSFSTFTIVWKTSYSMEVKYIDENGNELRSKEERGKVSISNNTIDFTSYKNDVDGYKFLYATAYENNSVNDCQCTSAKLEETKHWFWTEYKIDLLDQSGNVKFTANNYVPKIYLVYRQVKDSSTDDSLCNTISTRNNFTVNLFDYKVNSADRVSESITTPKSYSAGEGINKNHYLKFISRSNEGEPNQNLYIEGYGARQGIVNNRLGADGYPTLSSWGNNESLAYLFNRSDITNAKKCYTDVDKLFIKDSEGYYYYNSEEQYATVAADPMKKEFTVYKGKKQGFFPFTAYDKATKLGPSDYGDALGTSEINHFFGLTVDTDFLQPMNGMIDGKPMVFEFSGDDDVWLFIDDVLVLDIGGIHGKVGGNIDFSTGKVVVDNVGTKPVETTIKALFEQANGSVDEEQFEGDTFASHTTHTMKFFYVERGNYNSNCKLKFNLQTLPKGDLFVSKVATGVAEDDESLYDFILKDSQGNPVVGATYKKNSSEDKFSTDSNGHFSLKKNEYAIISGLNAGQYTVTETGISNSKYHLDEFITKISVNGSKSTESVDRAATVSVHDAASSRVEFRNLRDEVSQNSSDYRKYIKYNETSDDYDLTLSFKGPEEKVTSTDFEETTTTTYAKADLVFVVDMSGSMQSNNKLTNAKKAINTMLDILKEKKVDAKYKMVTFSSSASIKNEKSGWVDSSTFSSWVEALNSPQGGTNYQAALVKAQKAISANIRSDAEQIVLFVTDGEPTFHNEKNGIVSNEGTSTQGGGNWTKDTDYKGALMGARALTGSDMFYSVGIGLNEVEKIYNGKTALNILEDVTNAVPNAQIKGAYNSQSTKLEELFSTLAEKIVTDVNTIVTETYYYSSKVTITDTLSQYAEAVEGSEFSISALDTNGMEVGRAENGVLGTSDAKYTIIKDNKTYVLQAKYDRDNKRVSLQFPDDYQLDSGLVYSMTFRVKATTVAYEEYKTSGYNQVGDQDTDAVGNNTSSGKPGFRSNKKATVSYTFKGQQHTQEYRHPVIQVRKTAEWELYKVSESSGDVKLQGAEFQLANGENSYTGKSDASGKVIWNESIIKPGVYVLKETKAPVGYELSKLELIVEIDGSNKISVKDGNNEYKPESSFVTESDGVTNTVYVFTFTNKALFSLPQAGGNGIFVYMISGMLMMIGGALLIYKRRKSLVI